MYRHPAEQQPDLIPWTPAADELRKQVIQSLGGRQDLNHALIQWYRDGNDFISEHSGTGKNNQQNEREEKVVVGGNEEEEEKTRRRRRRTKKKKEEEEEEREEEREEEGETRAEDKKKTL